MRRATWLGSALVGLLLACSATKAATLTGIDGAVLVNHGGGFTSAHGTTPLSTGDTVIANPGGRAKVVYDDNCTVSVEPGSVVTVADKSPCSVETGAVASPQPGPSPSGQPDASPGEQPSFFNNTTVLVAGGVVVGGGVAAAVVLLTQNNSPASP